MTRDSMLVVLMLLVAPAGADEPSWPSKAIGIVAVGDENLLGPVAYGDTAQFWEAHALVFGTVKEARLEYDPAKLIVREHLGIQVAESIPDRYVHKRRLLTRVFERSVVAYDRPAEPPPMQYHVGDELMLMVSSKREFASYAMMPDGQEVCVVKELKAPLVEETRRLCQALATADVSKRLVRIDSLLKEKPNNRVQLVLQRRLEATTEELQVGLQEAKRLIQTAKGTEARRPPEESMSGIVTATSGRVVVLQKDEFFSINKDTRYFRETGRDPAETTAEVLTQGTALTAVGNKDIDVEFVASRVYALFGNVLRGSPTGPRPME